MFFEKRAVLLRHDDTRCFLGGGDGEPQRHDGHGGQKDLGRGRHISEGNYEIRLEQKFLPQIQENHSLIPIICGFPESVAEPNSSVLGA